MTRLFALAFAMALAGPGPALALTYDDAEALIEQIYEGYVGGREADALGAGASDVFTLELAERVEAASFEFDPIVDGQDYDIDALRFLAVGESDDTVVIDAAFQNFGEPKRVRFTVVDTPAGPRVSEVEGNGYTLSELVE